MLDGYRVILNDGFLGRESGFIQRIEDAEVIAKKMAEDNGGVYKFFGFIESKERIQKHLKELNEGDTTIIKTTIGVTISDNFSFDMFQFNLERK